MHPKLKEVLDMLSTDELSKIKDDIEQFKGFHLKRLVEEKLKSREHKDSDVCAICLSGLMPYATSNYTLMFGPKDFKKKVSFCSNDCLHHFLANMDKSRKLELDND